MAPRILSRHDKFTHINNRIAGGLIIGIFVLVVLLCLLCFFRHQRIKANRKRRATPFRVRGFIRPMTTEVYPRSGSSIPTFSRDRLTASIVMPEKSITRKPYACGLSDKAGFSYKILPSPAASTSSLDHPLPKTAPPRSHVLSILNPVHPRHSRSSSGFSGYSQYRYFSSLISGLSFSSSALPFQARLVQQSFEPTLPDELALQCGEHLSVLQSFDDGWCVVARDTLRTPCSPPSRLSAGMKNNGDNVDVGLVPAWVFAKPLEGAAPMRPFRSTSLNVLRLGRSPATRDMVFSWSTFA